MLKTKNNFNNLSNEEYSIYARHLILEQIGVYGQKKLKNIKILTVGAGGLSSAIMLYLVASGIGYIGIIENDNIEISNLNRQILYDTNDVEKPKIDIAKEKLKKINKNCKIITHAYRLNKKNALEIIKYYHIIIDGSDNFETRYIIDISCYKLHKTHIYGGINKFEGQIGILNYKSGIKYSDIYPKYLDLNNNTCNENGILGVIAGTIGLLQATEAIKITLGIGNILDNSLIIYKLLSSSFYQKTVYPLILLKNSFYKKKVQINRNNINKIITSQNQLNYIINQNKSLILIIDIRDNICFINKYNRYIKAINIPLHKIYIKNTIKFLYEYNIHKTIVIYCDSMYRSLIASHYLQIHQIQHYILNH